MKPTRRVSNGRPRSLLAAALLLVAWTGGAARAAGVSMVDVTESSGIRSHNLCGAEPGKKGWISENMGAGAAWLDYDLDGNLDLYIANGSTYERGLSGGEPNRLYRGDGKGHFSEVTDKAGVGHTGWAYGVAVGDIDNDGYPDVYVANFGTNVLFHNKGDGTFEDITASAGVADNPAYWTSSVAFFDMDQDGDLDLYVSNYMDADPKKVPRRGAPEAKNANCIYKGIEVVCGPMGQIPLQDTLYRNNGDLTFSDATREAGVWLAKPRFALGVVVADYNNDGMQDVYVANDSVQNSLWKNLGGGKFKDVGVETLCALNADGRPQAGMGTNFGDYNADGWLDVVVTNFAHDLTTIYKNLGGRFFMDDTMIAGLGVTYLNLSWGIGFHDFDHDGDEDLFVANGHIYPQVDGFDIGTRFKQENHLFLNTNGRFKESSADCGPAFELAKSFRSAAFGDYDNDGDLDVFLTALNDDATLFRNDHTGNRHHLQLRLIGEASNRDAVGARIVLTGGGKQQIRERKGGGSYMAGHDPRVHFGLGDATKAERIEIRWPSGKVDVLENVAADQVVTVREGKGKVD